MRATGTLTLLLAIGTEHASAQTKPSSAPTPSICETLDAIVTRDEKVIEIQAFDQLDPDGAAKLIAQNQQIIVYLDLTANLGLYKDNGCSPRRSVSPQRWRFAVQRCNEALNVRKTAIHDQNQTLLTAALKDVGTACDRTNWTADTD